MHFSIFVLSSNSFIFVCGSSGKLHSFLSNFVIQTGAFGHHTARCIVHLANWTNSWTTLLHSLKISLQGDGLKMPRHCDLTLHRCQAIRRYHTCTIQLKFSQFLHPLRSKLQCFLRSYKFYFLSTGTLTRSGWKSYLLIMMKDYNANTCISSWWSDELNVSIHLNAFQLFRCLIHDENFCLHCTTDNFVMSVPVLNC